jgi:hypothetical protein
MSLVERCVHQFLNPVWESCKICAYDSENNKKCKGYSPTAYEIPDKIQEIISENNLSVVYSAKRSDLGEAIAS